MNANTDSACGHWDAWWAADGGWTDANGVKWVQRGIVCPNCGPVTLPKQLQRGIFNYLRARRKGIHA